MINCFSFFDTLSYDFIVCVNRIQNLNQPCGKRRLSGQGQLEGTALLKCIIFQNGLVFDTSLVRLKFSKICTYKKCYCFIDAEAKR